MNSLVFVPSHNTPGKSDVSGAFRPEALNFVRLRNLDAAVVQFDNTLPLPARRITINRELAKAEGKALSVVAFFCHGWKNGLQAGHVLATVPDLAKRLAKCLAPDAVIVLYACDTARDKDGLSEDDKLTGPGGAGGFASALFVALHGLGLTGVKVYGHSTAGHATRNPYVRVWREDADLHAGDWVIDPGSKVWGTWRKRLELTALRFDFPFLSADEISARLST